MTVENFDDFLIITCLLSFDNNNKEHLNKLSNFINTNMKINGVEWKNFDIVPCNKNPYNFSLRIKTIINETLISITQLSSILTIHSSLRLEVLSLQTYNYN
jgi:hypothetical protein